MSLNYQNLDIHLQEDVVILTINRPKFLNALNGQTIKELQSFFTEDYLKIKDLKGVVITGAGDKSFIAGADISEFNALGQKEGQALSKEGQEVFFLIERFHKPVIAAVNGFALGGGCELAMACHLRIASPAARFGQPEVNLALIPGYGGTQRLVQLIGKGKALELLMTGDMVDAETALKLGLVNHVVAFDELISFASKLIAKIARKGPIAIAKVIETVNAYFNKNVDGFNLENQNFGLTIATEDSKEGASAFIEKRKASFKGM